MKKTIKKTLTLAVVAGALAAMAIPSMASAANWGVPGVPNTLNGNAGISINVLGTTYGLNCTGINFGVRARVPASSTLDINSATGFTCTGVAGMFWSGCKATGTPATALPWTASGASTTNVTLNSISYNLLLSNPPGQTTCGSWAGKTVNLSGTLTGGVWTNTFGSRKAVYSSAPGLSTTGVGFPFPGTATTTATFNATTLTLS